MCLELPGRFVLPLSFMEGRSALISPTPACRITGLSNDTMTSEGVLEVTAELSQLPHSVQDAEQPVPAPGGTPLLQGDPWQLPAATLAAPGPLGPLGMETSRAQVAAAVEESRPDLAVAALMTQRQVAQPPTGPGGRGQRGRGRGRGSSLQELPTGFVPAVAARMTQRQVAQPPTGPGGRDCGLWSSLQELPTGFDPAVAARMTLLRQQASVGIAGGIPAAVLVQQQQQQQLMTAMQQQAQGGANVSG